MGVASLDQRGTLRVLEGLAVITDERRLQRPEREMSG